MDSNEVGAVLCSMSQNEPSLGRIQSDHDCTDFNCLTLSQTNACFTCLQYEYFENTVEKGEIARNKQFLLFPLCFLPFCTTFRHFHQI